jgi:hypothetical protein
MNSAKNDAISVFIVAEPLLFQSPGDNLPRAQKQDFIRSDAGISDRQNLTILSSAKHYWACLEKMDTNSGGFDV